MPALVAALVAYIEVLAGQAILSHRFWTGLTGLGPMGGSQVLYTSCRAFKFFCQKHPGATLDSIQAPQDSPGATLDSIQAPQDSPVTPRIPTVPPWIPFRPPRIPPVPPRIPTVSPWEPLAPMSQPAPETLPRYFRDTSVLLPSLFRCLPPDFPHCFRLSVCESRGIFYLG